MIVAFQGRYDAETTVYVDLSAIVAMVFDGEEFEIDMLSSTASDDDDILRVTVIIDNENETPDEAKARILKAWTISRRKI